MVDKNAGRDNAIKALREKSSIVKRALGTDAGEKLIQILEDEFNSDNIMTPNDPYATHYNLGRRDVVMYLRQLQRFDK